MDSPRNTSPRKHQEITIPNNKIQVENRLFISQINLKSEGRKDFNFFIGQTYQYELHYIMYQFCFIYYYYLLLY